jgi:putative transposase
MLWTILNSPSPVPGSPHDINSFPSGVYLWTQELPCRPSDLAAWLTKWSGKYSKLTGLVEENIDETLTFYRLPRQHHKHLKSTNMLERLNEEIRRRTQVVRIFPNGESCLRLVRALAVETQENWLEQHRYLNMDDLREYKKEALRRAA